MDRALGAAGHRQARWESQRRAAPARADNIRIPRAFRGSHLHLYESLVKAGGAEKIGLRAFLFRRGVPGIATPACPCGRGDQTAAHLLTECADEKSRAMRVMAFSTRVEVWRGLSDYKKAPAMARVLVAAGVRSYEFLTRYCSKTAWRLKGNAPEPEPEPGDVAAESDPAATAPFPLSSPPIPGSGVAAAAWPRTPCAAPLTLTSYPVLHDCCTGFYPAGTVSPVDRTGLRHRMPLGLADVAFIITGKKKKPRHAFRHSGPQSFHTSFEMS